MNRGIIVRIFICIAVFGFCLYSHIDKQNQLTKLRIQLPAVAKEVSSIQEENTRLQYKIDQFEDPTCLMQLARAEAYSHLKHPLYKEVVTINRGKPLEGADPDKKESEVVRFSPRVVVGVKH